MSIIMTPYEQEPAVSAPSSRADEEELLVFGYACKLFRDDTKALLEDSGQLLIPWMGDGSLLVDRYDIRNRLEDKSQFGLKPSLPRKITVGEREMEDVLDNERYLGLDTDIMEHELMEEEAMKRAQETTKDFKAVGFTYKNQPPSKEREEEEEEAQIPAHLPELIEHPPTSTVDTTERGAPFIMPSNLTVPGHIKLPVTSKLHSIIQKTAIFLSRQGTQMEIMIKAKQKFNPFFSFLFLYDPLHAYYRHLLQLIATGEYIPQEPPEEEEEEQVEKEEQGEEKEEEVKVEEEEQMEEGREMEDEKVEGGGEEAGEEEIEERSSSPGAASDEDSADSDATDDDFELHPLLRVSASTPRASPKPHPVPDKPASPENPTAPQNQQKDREMFYDKSFNINSAPSLDKERASTAYSYPHSHSNSHTSETHHHHPYYQNTEGYTYSTQTDYSNQHSLEAYYHRLSAQHINKIVEQEFLSTPHPPHPSALPHPHSSTPLPYPPHHSHPHHSHPHPSQLPPTSAPPPPPPDLQPIIDKTAEYVARNSEHFERTVLQRHCGDPKFEFLNPWNKYYTYYKMKIHKVRESITAEGGSSVIQEDEWEEKEEEEGGEVSGRESQVETPKNIQRLSESGAVSFKLEKKVAKVLEPFVDLKTRDEEEEEGDAVGEEEEEEQEEECDGQEENVYDIVSGQSVDELPQAQNNPSCHEVVVQDPHMSGQMVHYSSKDTVEDGKPPPPKRAKVDSDARTKVIDFKVKEFLNEVKAVLDPS